MLVSVRLSGAKCLCIRRIPEIVLVSACANRTSDSRHRVTRTIVTSARLADTDHARHADRSLRLSSPGPQLAARTSRRNATKRMTVATNPTPITSAMSTKTSDIESMKMSARPSMKSATA